MSAVMCRLLHCWQNPGLLTDIYLTSHISKVLYVSNSNSNLYWKWLFYTFLFVSALVFFITMRSLWYSQIFHIFYHICKAEMSFPFPWKRFCCDLVCCNMEINPYALCLWICYSKKREYISLEIHSLKMKNCSKWSKPEHICIKVLRSQVLFNICAISRMQISHWAMTNNLKARSNTVHFSKNKIELLKSAVMALACIKAWSSNIKTTGKRYT